MQLLDELIQIKLTGISPKTEVCKISKGKESFQKAREQESWTDRRGQRTRRKVSKGSQRRGDGL